MIISFRFSRALRIPSRTGGGREDGVHANSHRASSHGGRMQVACALLYGAVASSTGRESCVCACLERSSATPIMQQEAFCLACFLMTHTTPSNSAQGVKFKMEMWKLKINPPYLIYDEIKFTTLTKKVSQQSHDNFGKYYENWRNKNKFTRN